MFAARNFILVDNKITINYLSVAGGAGGGASDGPDTAANGGKGGDGRITINYSSPPIPLVITTGGWKTIESIYYKDSNNVWQPISQSGNITLYNYT